MSPLTRIALSACISLSLLAVVLTVIFVIASPSSPSSPLPPPPPSLPPKPKIEVILTNNVDCKIREYVTIQNLSVREYLLKLGTNKPKTRETAEICLLYSNNIQKFLKRDHREVHYKLFEVFGAYDLYLYTLYELEGNNTELFDAVNKLGVLGGNINDIYQLYERRSCLGGFSRFNNYDGYHKYSWCNQPNEISKNNQRLGHRPDYADYPELRNRYQQMASWTHEYFHHYQIAHHLEKRMGMERDCETSGFCTNTNTPAWFVEGQANLMVGLFFKENFNNLTISKENNITFDQIFKRDNELYGQICGAILCDLNSNYRSAKEGFLGVHKNTDQEYKDCPEFTVLEDFREGRVCSWQWISAAAYMGYISSCQTAFVDMFNDINKIGFDAALEKHYGLTKLEFYKQYSNFMRSDPSNLTPPPGFFPNKLSEAVNFFLVDSGN